MWKSRHSTDSGGYNSAGQIAHALKCRIQVALSSVHRGMKCITDCPNDRLQARNAMVWSQDSPAVS